MRENGYCKFVFIGAGSSVFTLRLIGDILKEIVLTADILRW